MSDVIIGTSVLLLANTGSAATPNFVVVAHQRGMDMNSTRETIDASSKDQPDQVVAPGRLSGDVTVDGLYVPNDTAYQALRDAHEAGAYIKVREQEAGVATREADALVTSLGASHPDQGASTISIGLQISGGWTNI